MKYAPFRGIYESAQEVFCPIVDEGEVNDIVDLTLDYYMNNNKNIERVYDQDDETGTLPLYFLLDMVWQSKEKVNWTDVGWPAENLEKAESIMKNEMGASYPKNPEKSFNMMATKYYLMKSTMEDEEFNNWYYISFVFIDERTFRMITAIMDLYWLGKDIHVKPTIFEDELYAEYLCSKRPKDGEMCGTAVSKFFNGEVTDADGNVYKAIDKVVNEDFSKEILKGEYTKEFYNKLIRWVLLDKYNGWNRDTERFVDDNGGKNVFSFNNEEQSKYLNEETIFPDDVNVEEVLTQIRSTIENSSKKKPKATKKPKTKAKKKGPFMLTGRKELNTFFNDSIIDVVNNEKTYAKFGIGFPEPFILEGPPGCGKTYAVKQLEEYLGWETFHITSSSVGSQFIHETSKLIERTFEAAAEYNKAMVVIDEMDSFMPKRTDAKSSDSHIIEEVSAFLKCLQTAQENKILVVGMTNFIENIDPAILRSGRMGTHIKVSWPSEEEITQVLTLEMDKRPYDKKIDLASFAPRFKEKPLSDVTAVVRRASMSAARRRAKKVSKEDLEEACAFILKEEKKEERRVMGFCA